MIKVKPLLPTLRERKRYLAYELITPNANPSFKDVATAMTQELLSLLGTVGLGKAGVIILGNSYDPKVRRGLIKVNYKYVNHLRTGLMMVRNIQNEPVIIKTLGVSGIIKKAKERYVRRE